MSGEFDDGVESMGYPSMLTSGEKKIDKGLSEDELKLIHLNPDVSVIWGFKANYLGKISHWVRRKRSWHKRF